MELFEIYQNGVDAWSMLHRIKRQITTTNARPGEPQSVDKRIDYFIDKMRMCQSWFARCPQNDIDRAEYERDMRECENAIVHLKELANSHFIARLIDAGIIALGFSKIDNPFPIPIHPHEWAFLELDFKTSNARCNGREYRAIRFFELHRLSEDAWTVIKAALFPESPAPPDSTPAPESGSEAHDPELPMESDSRPDEPHGQPLHHAGNHRVTTDPYAESRTFCVKAAAELWTADPNMRIGEIVEILDKELIEKRLKCPKPDTIREWLKQAEREGHLVIPAEAKKPGRPSN